MNAPELNSLPPTLVVREVTAYANSKEVAEFFEKQHPHVLRDIDHLRKGLSKLGDTSWFVERYETNPQNKQGYRCFEMTRDGFTLLVMGYEGEAALGFKVRYISAFNAMEAEIRKGSAAHTALPVPQSMPEALRLAADAWEAKALAEAERERAEAAKVEAEARVAELIPPATVGMVAAASGHSLMTVLRGLPFVNVNKAQGALADLGYLRRVPKGRGRCIFRVNRSRAAEHFIEGVPDEYGGAVITPTAKGRLLLGRLYRGGHLPMLAGHKPQRMLKAIGAA